MKNNKLNDYKKMDEAALMAELKALKQELFKLRLSKAMNGLDNPQKIVETKKNIARINTILTIKENGGTIVIKEIKKKVAKKKDAKSSKTEAKSETKASEKAEVKEEKTTKKVAKKEKATEETK